MEASQEQGWFTGVFNSFFSEETWKVESFFNKYIHYTSDKNIWKLFNCALWSRSNFYSINNSPNYIFCSKISIEY